MTPNIPLLRKMVEWVEEQEQLSPEESEWRQGFYVIQKETLRSHWCGTAMCVAGKVAWDAGWKPVWENGGCYRVHKDGDVEWVSNVAEGLLGLDAHSRRDLFDGLNTAADIRRIAEEIAGERL